jgi:hypothetical protein
MDSPDNRRLFSIYVFNPTYGTGYEVGLRSANESLDTSMFELNPYLTAKGEMTVSWEILSSFILYAEL